MSKFSYYEYRKLPGFDMNAFKGANQAIPMKTLVIYCFDPRAADIPKPVAAYFGDEVYPGENILDESGNRVGHTRTLFTETNAGGEKSIKYDIELLRSSPAVPKHVKLYGFFYEISSAKLTEVVRNIPAQLAA
jgi:hypothetical protein